MTDERIDPYGAKLSEQAALIDSLRKERDELAAKVQGNAADLLSAWGQLEEKDARIKELEAELAEARAERYIGVACPGCGRMRLLYTPGNGDIRCEKCERDREQLYDLDPATRLNTLEQALREIDQNTRLSVAELRAIARAAIAATQGEGDEVNSPLYPGGSRDLDSI